MVSQLSTLQTTRMRGIGSRKLDWAVPIALAFLLPACAENEDEAFDTETYGVAAEEMVELDEPAEPVATCEDSPPNGAILTDSRQSTGGPHNIAIANGSNGNAIVNVRDWDSNNLVLSFLVLQAERADVGGIPDGTYRIQYAFGDELAEDCQSFTEIQAASVDPEANHFEPGSPMRLTYELRPQVGGNFSGQPIDPAEFTGD
ncbi:MAG: hypothetical protein LC634_00055 [Sphingomonadales bacterium]|nr:hypothetical protein [Sphingomonadales bacterium]